MQGDQHPAKVALRQARETTIEQLSDSFSRDELSLEEFEHRVEPGVYRGQPDEMQALVRDLTVAQTAPMRVAEAAEPQPATALVPLPAPQALSRRHQDFLAYAVFGNVERQGHFAVKAASRALAVFGNVELDLRSVTFPPGVTDIEVQAIFGNVEIIVPPTIFVECHGASIFGSFASAGRLPLDQEGETVLRIYGRAIFGNVELFTLPVQVDRGERHLAHYRR